MGIGLLIALIVVLTAVSIALPFLMPTAEIEDAKPSGLGDFNFPTATEGRVLPVVFGTAEIRGPNVLWYGDLRSVAQHTGGVVVAYAYYFGMDLALCHGPLDAISALRLDEAFLFTSDRDSVITDNNQQSDKVKAGGLAYSINGDTSAPIVKTIDDASFFGARKSGGGVVGDFYIYLGGDRQNPDEYIQGVENARLDANEDPDPQGQFVPGYNSIAHAVWGGGQFGESTNLRQFVFTVHRYPNGLSELNKVVNADPISGHGDANPAHCIWDILTNTVWGLGVSPSMIDRDSFLDVAVQCQAEGLGYGRTVDTAKSASTVLNDIHQQIGSMLNQDATGKFSLKLIRQDYVVDDLPLYGASDIIKVVSVDRQAWSETFNTVQLKYMDRTDKFKETYATAHDMGNLSLTNGRQVIKKLDMQGIRTPASAARVAQRELKAASYPLVAVSVELTKASSNLRPGDVVRINFPEYNLNSIVLRVGEIVLSDGKGSYVKVIGYEDIFSTPADSDLIYSGGSTSLRKVINLDALPATKYHVFPMPSFIERFYAENTNTYTSQLPYDTVKSPDTVDPNDVVRQRAMHVVAAPDGINNSFETYHEDINGTNVLSVGDKAFNFLGTYHDPSALSNDISIANGLTTTDFGVDGGLGNKLGYYHYRYFDLIDRYVDLGAAPTEEAAWRDAVQAHMYSNYIPNSMDPAWMNYDASDPDQARGGATIGRIQGQRDPADANYEGFVAHGFWPYYAASRSTESSGAPGHQVIDEWDYLPAISVKGVDLSLVGSQIAGDIQQYGRGLILMGDPVKGNWEFMAFEETVESAIWEYPFFVIEYIEGSGSITYWETRPVPDIGLNRVHRGLFDTGIQHHEYGEEVWFIPLESLAYDQRDIAIGYPRTYKYVSKTPEGELDITLAPTDTITEDELKRPHRPLPPKNVTINAGAVNEAWGTFTRNAPVYSSNISDFILYQEGSFGSPGMIAGSYDLLDIGTSDLVVDFTGGKQHIDDPVLSVKFYDEDSDDQTTVRALSYRVHAEGIPWGASTTETEHLNQGHAYRKHGLLPTDPMYAVVQDLAITTTYSLIDLDTQTTADSSSDSITITRANIASAWGFAGTSTKRMMKVTVDAINAVDNPSYNDSLTSYGQQVFYVIVDGDADDA